MLTACLRVRGMHVCWLSLFTVGDKCIFSFQLYYTYYYDYVLLLDQASFQTYPCCQGKKDSIKRITNNYWIFKGSLRAWKVRGHIVVLLIGLPIFAFRIHSTSFPLPPLSLTHENQNLIFRYQYNYFFTSIWPFTVDWVRQMYHILLFFCLSWFLPRFILFTISRHYFAIFLYGSYCNLQY